MEMDNKRIDILQNLINIVDFEKQEHGTFRFSKIELDEMFDFLESLQYKESSVQNTIDEEKLDELAEKEKFNRLIVDKLSEFTEYEGYKINLLMKDMYKAGYRKAKEE